jgi:hypothetical protein
MADFLIFDDDNNKKTESHIQEETKKTNLDISLMDKLNNLLFSFQKIKTKDKVIFYRLLSTMTNA